MKNTIGIRFTAPASFASVARFGIELMAGLATNDAQDAENFTKNQRRSTVKPVDRTQLLKVAYDLGVDSVTQCRGNPFRIDSESSRMWYAGRTEEEGRIQYKLNVQVEHKKYINRLKNEEYGPCAINPTIRYGSDHLPSRIKNRLNLICG